MSYNYETDDSVVCPKCRDYYLASQISCPMCGHSFQKEAVWPPHGETQIGDGVYQLPWGEYRTRYCIIHINNGPSQGYRFKVLAKTKEEVGAAAGQVVRNFRPSEAYTVHIRANGWIAGDEAIQEIG